MENAKNREKFDNLDLFDYFKGKSVSFEYKLTNLTNYFFNIKSDLASSTDHQDEILSAENQLDIETPADINSLDFLGFHFSRRVYSPLVTVLYL